MTIKELPYPSFKRKGNDLYFKQKISLVDALLSAPFQFTALDGRNFPLTLSEVVSPQSVKMVKGEGMPICEKNALSELKGADRKGDLYVTFDIQFPKRMDQDTKEELARILDEGEEEEEEEY